MLRGLVGSRRIAAVVAFAWVLVVAGSSSAEVIGRCGRGYLEMVDGHRVLHLKGTPYEMGYQHGTLLREEAKLLVHHLFEVKGKEQRIDFMGTKLAPKQIVAQINQYQKKYVPARYYEELRGLADASGIPYDDVVAANTIPELFHCSGFALLRELTVDNTLLHGRVLDYAVDWRLQERAVLIVAEPEGKIPFANITYAGFIGSVTGMNNEQISLGEMGGGGLFKWDGTPMAFLMRRALEEAKTLDDAIAIFRDSKRTCEYYYVFADGKSNRAVGLEAGNNTFRVVKPGEKIDLLPTPVPNAVLLSAGKRYECLCDLVGKVQSKQGKFTVDQAIHLMDAPVAMKSNLHDVLMAPAQGKLWVKHASADKQPAWTQKCYALDFRALLKQEFPTSGGKEYPAPPKPPVQAAAR